MAVTSYTLARTATTIDRDPDDANRWTGYNDAKLRNANYAESLPDKETRSEWLRLTNFDFDIPVGATIVGIEVQIKRYADVVTIIEDDAIYLRKTVGQVGNNYASATTWPTTVTIETYGGATILWGTTWNAADINSSDFGIDIANYNTASDDTTKTYVDYADIRIHYTTEAATGTNIQVNVNDAMKDVATAYVNVDDSWKEVANAYCQVDDAWKTIF